MARKSGSRTGKKSTVRPSSRSSKSRSNRPQAASRSGASARSSENRKVLTMPKRSDAEAGGGRSQQSRVLTDQEEILQWAEERDARPASVRGTGGRSDIGMIRLEFPGFGSEQSLEEIEWDDWFRKFDESRLALLVQDETAAGEKSNFNKLVKRETAEGKRSSTRHARGRRRSA